MPISISDDLDVHLLYLEVPCELYPLCDMWIKSLTFRCAVQFFSSVQIDVTLSSPSVDCAPSRDRPAKRRQGPSFRSDPIRAVVRLFQLHRPTRIQFTHKSLGIRHHSHCTISRRPLVRHCFCRAQNWFIVSPTLSIDWIIHSLRDRGTVWLIDWLILFIFGSIDRSIDWLVYWWIIGWFICLFS